jgi:uncharacterized protein
MNCPKCSSPMLKVDFAGAEVERCTQCYGLFFEAFDKARLQKLKDPESLDNGDPATGRRMNRVDRIVCPRCASPMIRMVDFDQPHIWFEHCTVCAGSFFDAGEFKDLMHHTVTDFFKDLLVKERR